MRAILTMLSVCAACWHATPTAPTTTAQPVEAERAQPEATHTQVTQPPPPPPPAAECVFDATAKQACDARGPGFSYGPRPYIYCSGVAPKPGTEQREFEAIRNSPCTCNDDAAIAEQRQSCSRVPSMAPRR